ncbi:MAG: stage III sporulation protein AC [Christensenellaceae bacterium]|nr:stage III sporulation protein AC [Christensenellaceae bacterium]
MDIDVIFKIAGIGILATVVCSILEQSGKKEIATFVSLSSVIICLVMVLSMISDLFSTIRNLFSLY